MVNEMQSQILSEDTYTSGKYSKVIDFFIGFGICYGIGAILGLLFMGVNFFWISFGFGLFTLGLFPGLFTLGLFPILGIFGFVVPLILTLVLAKKYFPNRRLVRVGAWIAFVLPIFILLLLFGACLITIGGGW